MNRSEEPKIRPARESDMEQVRRIAVEAWRPIFEQFRKTYGDEFFFNKYPDWEEHKGSRVVGQFKRDPSCMLVTECAGRVVGFITFYLQEDVKIGVIGNNAVHPDFQGRGVGSRQYREVLELFRKKGMKFATVHTGLDPSHAPARAAYEKVGFKQGHPSVEYFLKL